MAVFSFLSKKQILFEPLLIYVDLAYVSRFINLSFYKYFS